MTFPAKRAPRLPRQACVQDALNEAGRAATEHCLRLFDSAGTPVEVAGRKLTTKGPTPKKYQTPYGEVNLPRHVYQDSGGGGTFCPLENDARIVNATTPRLAQMCARKYASMNSQLAREDLRQSYRREVSRCYLQDTAAAVADIVQSKGEHWRYTPAIDGVVASVAVGIAATSVLYCQEGYRMAMVGTLSLYDYEGDRLHSIYVAHPPQYGKEHFLKKMVREIELLRERYPWAHWVGVADGAKDNWPWLEGHTQTQVLDYFHAASYLEGAAAGMRARKAPGQEWLERSKDELQHRRGGCWRR